MTVTVVVPAYNEEQWITRALERMLAQPEVTEIVVVDDASTDGTRRAVLDVCARDGRVRLLSHETNAGKGGAVRTGIAASRGEIVVIHDADLEYDPADYPDLLAPIFEGKADGVFGSRFVGGKAHRVLYFWHSVANRGLTLVSNAFTNLNLTDMECCLKAFRVEFLQKIAIRENRFGIEPELAAGAARLGMRIYEVGVSYSGRTYDEGKKITWRDGIDAIRAILVCRFFR